MFKKRPKKYTKLSNRDIALVTVGFVLGFIFLMFFVFQTFNYVFEQFNQTALMSL